MSVSVGRYTFLSWLRRGIGNRIDQPDLLAGGASGVAERATVQVDVLLNGAAINKSFALLGPGDIIGINPLMVVRTEPANPGLNPTLEFEPNYLAFIEFYEEDFLWRYTPAKPSGEKLSPWLVLLVLKSASGSDPGEFELVPRSEPLPLLKVIEQAALPPLSRNWALGHVRINEGHSSPTDFEAFLLSLRTDAPNADKIISCLFSARRLDPDTAYSAFLVPAFETGRRAGLGQDTAGVDAQQPAWSATSVSAELPIYYEWSFRTGKNEDFESLVKRLEPRPVDSRVGIRDIDGATPGFGVAIGADIGAIPPTGAPQTTIGLEGALRAPTTVSRPAAIDPAKPFFAALAGVLNLGDDRRQASLGTADPVVTPPIYGGHHAMRERVEMDAAGWLTELNRDPRLRVSSGFGTRVVQTNQEDYVARAWAQVKAVLAANRQFILSRAALESLRGFQQSFVAKLPAASVLAFAQSVTRKVMGSPVTIRRLIVDSRVTAAPLDAAARRLIAPRRRIGRRLAAADPEFAQHRLIEDINSGRVTAAPPKEIAGNLVDDADLTERMTKSVPAWLRFLDRHLWPIVLVLLALALVALIAGLWPVALGLAVAAAVTAVAVRRANRRVRAAAALANPATLAGTLSDIAPRPGFTFIVTDPPPGASGAVSVGPVPGRPPGVTGATVSYSTPAGAGRDTVEAASFRTAAIAMSERFAIRPNEPGRPPLDLAHAAGKVVAAMAPEVSVLRLLAGQVTFPRYPDWLSEPEHLVPAIAYPSFDDAMYAKLRDISTELLLPNIGLIPPETITLLKTNPGFIESYMVGLNHEFGRELRWREYITDTRGSYFQQFWSVDGIVPPPPAAGAPGPTPDQLKAMYRDIVPIDTWPGASVLGKHRPPQRPNHGDLVLTLRGEIVKRHKMLIYAQKAHMARNKQGQLDHRLKPVIRTIATQAEMDAELKFPIFKAEVEPDIRFFGFDMLVAEAKGDEEPKVESDDWGWYFILQELPGEARFGMDTAYDPDDDPLTPITWNDLSWTKMPAGAFLDPAVPPVASFWNKLTSDLQQQWNRNAADMASVLFQRPVMIAVHAREMLENISA